MRQWQEVHTQVSSLCPKCHRSHPQKCAGLGQAVRLVILAIAMTGRLKIPGTPELQNVGEITRQESKSSLTVVVCGTEANVGLHVLT